jgi:hypothetical protein
MTLKSGPRYLFMVFAFAGDSTITKLLPIMKKIVRGYWPSDLLTSITLFTGMSINDR